MFRTVIVMKTVDTDKRQSADDFNNFVKPAIEKNCAAQIISLENLGGKLPLMLDRQFSTDALYLKGDKMYGVSSRVQRNQNWQTFTIRAERDSNARTELQKHSDALAKGEYLPEITVQTYINDGEITIGIAWTADILDYIKKNKTQAKHTNNSLDGQATFLCVSWYDMQQKKYKLTIIHEKIKTPSNKTE